jgi:hypothetical protein
MLGDQDPVAGVARGIDFLFFEENLESAVWADTFGDRFGGPPFHFVAAIHGEFEATLRARYEFLIAPKCLGHRAGGDDKRFRGKRFQH